MKIYLPKEEEIPLGTIEIVKKFAWFPVWMYDYTKVIWLETYGQEYRFDAGLGGRKWRKAQIHHDDNFNSNPSKLLTYFLRVYRATFF